MKVLHVIPTLSPQYGGPVTAILGMTTALSRAGLDVRLLTTGNPKESTQHVAGCDTRTVPSIFRAWKWSPALGRVIDEEVRWADVVTIHTLWTYPVATAARACLAAGVPYILRPAGMLDQWSLSQKRLKKKIYASLIERRTINRANALWFTSEEERAGARHFHYEIPEFVIPLGLDLEDYRELPPKWAFRDRFLNSSAKQIVLFLGRLARKKQPDVTLKAFAEIASDFEDSILVMAGPDDYWHAVELQKLATVLKIHDRVYFTGNLRKQEVVAALNDADVFVLPSLHENFGVAVVEAMASGTPVIVSDRVALASVVRESNAGIVIQPTREELSQSLREVLSRPEIGEEMGNHGRVAVLNKFGWDRIIPDITDVYLQIIKESEKRADSHARVSQ